MLTVVKQPGSIFGGVTVHQPQLLEPPMPRPSKSPRDDRTVKIARDLAAKAKVIADSKGITIAEYLSDLLRPHIQKDWPKAVRHIENQPAHESEERP